MREGNDKKQRRTRMDHSCCNKNDAVVTIILRYDQTGQIKRH